MKILIETIPKEQMSKVADGDWFWTQAYECPNCKIFCTTIEDFPTILECPMCKASLVDLKITETLHVHVASISDWKRETLIAIEQLTEALLLKHEESSKEK